MTHTGLRPKVPTRGLTPNQVRLLTNYIREHLSRNIALEELAGLVRLSGFYFCKAFRVATGKRPRMAGDGANVAGADAFTQSVPANH
jgi:AraC-like DNA-binding protein